MFLIINTIFVMAATLHLELSKVLSCVYLLLHIGAFTILMLFHTLPQFGQMVRELVAEV